MQLSAQFQAILDNPTATESDAMRFLKQYPMLMIRLFNVSWNYYAVFSEFPLGTDYRADFMVLSADSCGWHTVFIELEGPNDDVYLKDGSPAKKLRAAQKQVSDWEKYLRTSPQVVKHEISKRIRPNNVTAQNKLMGKGGKAHDELLLPDVFLDSKYKIMLGQRSSFANEPEKHMPSPGFGYGPQVSTFDRVVDCLVDMEENKYYKDVPEFLTHSDKYSLYD